MTKEQDNRKREPKQIVTLNDLPEKLEISDDISWRDVNDETIILHLKSGEYFTLNDTAKYLWKGICEDKQPRELVLLMAQDYNLKPEEVESDVLDFFVGLMQKDVFVWGELNL